MDNGDGRFRQVDSEHFKEMLKASMDDTNDRRIDKVFTIGEQVQVKASKFTVRNIDWLTGIMTLKLMPEKRF